MASLPVHAFKVENRSADTDENVYECYVSTGHPRLILLTSHTR
jgi:hypothetical protein